MTKTLSRVSLAASVVLAMQPTLADPICKKITLDTTQPLPVISNATPCSDPGVLAVLKASGQFPAVSYLADESPVFDHTCYLSQGSIKAWLGSPPNAAPVRIQSISAFTDNFTIFGTPFIFDPSNPAPGTIGTVASQFTFYINGAVAGRVYTHDVINFAPLLSGRPAVESDAVTGGTGIFTGVRGSLTLTSAPQDPSANSLKILSLDDGPSSLDGHVVRDSQLCWGK